MCVLILWFAATQYNKGPNNSFEIGIFTPYETQIDLIFKRLNQLIDGSEFMIELLDRRIHHRLEFSNGSIVYGLTAGANAGTNGGNNTRGQKGKTHCSFKIGRIAGNSLEYFSTKLIT